MDPKPRSVSEIFQQWWSKALTTVSGESDATKLLQNLQGATASLTPEELRKQVEAWNERMQAQRKVVEQRLEDGVKKAVEAVRVPTRDELARLSARMDRLAERLEALSR